MDSEAELFKSLRSTFYAMEMNYQNHHNLQLNKARSMLHADQKKDLSKKAV